MTAQDGSYFQLLRHDGTCYEVPPDFARIGRHSSNDIILTDRSVSRFHAILIETDAGLQVSDENSRSGTLVNGRRITGPQALAVGDVITIGESALRLIPGTGNSGSKQRAKIVSNWMPIGIVVAFILVAVGVILAINSSGSPTASSARAAQSGGQFGVDFRQAYPACSEIVLTHPADWEEMETFDYDLALVASDELAGMVLLCSGDVTQYPELISIDQSLLIELVEYAGFEAVMHSQKTGTRIVDGYPAHTMTLDVDQEGETAYVVFLLIEGRNEYFFLALVSIGTTEQQTKPLFDYLIGQIELY